MWNVGVDDDDRGQYMLASGSVDTKVKLWDLRSKDSIHTIRSHTKPITDVKISEVSFSDLNISVSSTMPFLVTASADSYIKTWDWRAARNIS